MATGIWWQKPAVRQAWDFARVASLLMLIPLAVVVGIQLWQQARAADDVKPAVVSAADFTPDGKTVVVIGSRQQGSTSDDFMAAWDTATGRLHWQIATTLGRWVVRASPRGDLVSAVVGTTYDSMLRLEVRNNFSGLLVRTIPLPPVSYAASWVAGGEKIAVWGPGQVTLHTISTGTYRLLPASFPTEPEGLRLANVPGQDAFLLSFGTKTNGNTNAVVQLRSLKDGSVLRTFEQGAELNAHVLSSGKRIVIANPKRGQVSLYDVGTGKRSTVVRLPRGFTVQGVFEAVDSDYLHLLLSFSHHPPTARSTAPDTTLWQKRWNLKTGELRPIWSRAINAFTIPAPDGQAYLKLRQSEDLASVPLAALYDTYTGDKLRALEPLALPYSSVTAARTRSKEPNEPSR